MKRLANLKNDLPSKSKLNKFQALNLKGGGDKRKKMGPQYNNGNGAAANDGFGG